MRKSRPTKVSLGPDLAASQQPDESATQKIWDENPAVERMMKGAPSGFVKHDAGKTRFSLVPAEARLEVAKVFTHGAKKYPPHNYRKGTEWSRYVDALHRHMNDFELGQNVDEESGLLTLAHVAACAMILLTLQKTGKGTDDRAQK